MGGKAKQAQRTKNNSRPSNSSRSAELLGSSVPAFVGFSTVENSGFVVPIPGISLNADNIFDDDSSLDNNFQLVMRKMNKKDPITKTKALQEFTSLIQKSDIEVVKTILPFWPRIYNNLSMDVENRVRETAQQAWNAIVTKLGKNIGPYLKQIFPAWLAGQFDTYAPAASVASSCFERAFPPNKISDVFAFCEDEILDYFTKNLIEHNPQTICNPKMYTPEECESKYIRVLIGSLRGYSTYLSKIPAEKLKSAASKNAQLIDNQKFWSYFKNKIAGVKSAWFEAMSSILQFGEFLLEKHEKQLTINVYQQLSESEPIILGNLWACVILVQVKIQNWHTYLNLDGNVFPKLWKVLRSPANASVIFPHLLPLVSNFNETILPDDKLVKFYTNFFENINHGLRNAQSSRSEVIAIATAYYEILKYVIIQITSKAEDGSLYNEICGRLLDDHLVAVIFWCINAETSSGRFIFHHIAGLVNYWSLNSKQNLAYSFLLDRFWSELYQVLQSSLELNQNIEKITSVHVELIQNLKSSTNPPKQKTVKVKFAECDGTDAVDADVECEKDKSLLSFETQLNQLVYKLCDIYIGKISETSNIEYISNLEILVKEYQSLELFSFLAQSRNQSDNICTLYDTFSQWLYVEELRCESIVEIILILYKYLRPVEKVDLLNKWIQIPIKAVQSWIILRALSHPLCVEPDINKLLKMPEVTNHLLDCARAVSNGVLKENLIVLHKCFFQTEAGDILIDTETCEKIINIICEPLSDPSRANSLDSCGSFLAQIMPVICSDENKKKLQEKVFLILFEFSINKMISDDLSEDTIWEVTTSWQDALSSEDLYLDDSLLDSCAKITKSKLLNISLKDLSMESIERFSEIVSKLILCSTEFIHASTDRLEKISKIVEKLLNQEDQEISKQEEYLKYLCTFIEMLDGNLITSSIQDNAFDTMNFEESLNQYLKHNLFVLNVILKISCNVKKTHVEAKPLEITEDIEDEIEYSDMKNQIEEECTDDYCDIDESLLKTWPTVIYDKFLELSMANALASSLILNSTNLNAQLEIWLIYLQEKFELCIKMLPENIVLDVKEKLFSLANTKGGFWAKSLVVLKNTRQYCESEINITLLYEDAVLASNQEENILSYCNILQSFVDVVPTKCLPIAPNLFENFYNLLVKVVATRSLIKNHFKSTDFNEIEDRKIIGNALIIINEILTKQKNESFLLCNEIITSDDSEKVLLVTEIAHLLADVLDNFPYELDIKRWDFIRITLSSWVLSISKSCDNFRNENLEIFIASVYRLHASLNKFIVEEKTKSSTGFLTGIIEEWENVFARETNKVLMKMFIHFIRNSDENLIKLEYFVNYVSSTIGSIDFNYILQANKVDATITLDDLIKFALENLSNKYHSVCIASANILKQLARGLIARDQGTLIKRKNQDYNDEDEKENNRWHILESFRSTMENHHLTVKDYIEDFSFKANELDDLSEISHKAALSYLLLWDCILHYSLKASAELRSVYARWISENHYEEVFLTALFKMMPRDILKNPDSGSKLGQSAYAQYDWKEISRPSVSYSRFAASMYSCTLKTLPAIVRKWWHSCNQRQAQMVEKITANYVSPLICQEELTALLNRKEERDNLTIKVHQQSRQVTATYTLEEAKMELLITLPMNHPLGAVKVEPTKFIKGKLHAQQVVMQLTIFLTHQNGSLWDGLLIWKRNLDRKFEGVQECYVCYSVIHQESYQLPRLTCKTCKNKFHGTCLYRWFHSSNKSTCPICRNMF